jgi:hypothetical protein
MAFIGERTHHETIIFMSSLILDQKNHIRNLEAYIGDIRAALQYLKNSFVLLHQKVGSSGTINASLYTSNRHLNEENKKLTAENCRLKHQHKMAKF